MTRYWCHSESGSLFSAPDSDEPNKNDPLCEEIDEATYRRLRWEREATAWGEDQDQLIDDLFGDLL